jgi:hypothetical protein
VRGLEFAGFAGERVEESDGHEPLENG